MPKFRNEQFAASSAEEVNKINQRDSNIKTPNNDMTWDLKGNRRKTSHFCWGEHLLKIEKSPARGKKCLNCGARNHFAKACRKSKKSQRSDAAVKQIEERSVFDFDSDSYSSEVDFIISITTTASAANSESLTKYSYAKEIYTVVEIGNHIVKFQIKGYDIVSHFFDGLHYRPQQTVVLNKTYRCHHVLSVVH